MAGAIRFGASVSVSGRYALQGQRAKAIGLAAAAMQEFPNALGTHAEGLLGPSQWEPRLAYDADFGPGPDEAAKGIRAQGAPPDYPAAQAYAACLITQRCLEEAGTDDGSLWRTACALDCSTFFGRFRIDPATGLQVGHEVVLVQWRQERKLVVWPPAFSQARPVYPWRRRGDDQRGPIDRCPSEDLERDESLLVESELVRTRCCGLVGAMIPSRLCCPCPCARSGSAR